MTTIAAARSQRKNRNRNARIAALRAEVEQLRRERAILARLALPTHPRGGLFDPLAAWDAKALAERVLAEAPR